MFLQLRMLRRQIVQSFSDGAAAHVKRWFLFGILPQRCWDVDLHCVPNGCWQAVNRFRLGSHSANLNEGHPEWSELAASAIEGPAFPAYYLLRPASCSTTTSSSTNRLFSSSAPASANELVTSALPFTTLVIT